MITRRHIRRWLVWLGIGVGALGLAGYILSFFTTIKFARGDRLFEFGRGAVRIYWVANSSMPIGQVPRSTYGWTWLPWCSEEQHAFNNAWRHGRLIVPFWIFVLIGAIAAYRLLPAGYPRGRCQECGYDLKGVPSADGGAVCPECGAAARA